MANVDKAKCNTACAAINSCYPNDLKEKLPTKTQRVAISNSTILVSQSKIAMTEAERNAKKEKKGKQSKKDLEGYVHKLQLLQENYQSIYDSIRKVYDKIINLQFVDKKVTDNLQTAKINFGAALGTIKKYAPVKDSNLKRRLSAVGIKLPPLK